MAAAATRRIDRRAVRDQRHEPPPGGPRPDGLDAPDRERRPALLGMGIGGAPKEHAAYGIDFPDVAERVARLEEAVAVIRALWTGGPVTRPIAVLPARRRASRSRSRPRRRRSSSAARRRPGRGWPAGSATAGRPSTTTSSRTCRSTSRRSRPRGRRRDDQRVLVGFQGDWLGDADRSRIAVGPRAARRLGALARGRRRRRDRPGPHHRRRRRARGRRRALVIVRPTASGPRPAVAARAARPFVAPSRLR